MRVPPVILQVILFCISASGGTVAPPSDRRDLLPLIRAVQRNSQRAYDAVRSVSFSGTSKTSFYFGYSPLEVDLVPVINEYRYDAFWMKPDSLRMVVRALRDIRSDTTRDRILESMPLPNPFHFTYDASILGMDRPDDEDDEMVWPLYPFSPGADSMYRYSLEDEIGFGDNVIYTIRVEPARPGFPAVAGTFQVDRYREEVVASDVQFTDEASLFVRVARREGTLFRVMVKGSDRHRIRTEKQLLYSSYWLPMRMEEEFFIHLWGMDVRVYRELSFDSYIVNPEEPDTSLLSSEKIVYRRDPVLEQVLYPDTTLRTRLSRSESEAIVRHIRDRLAARGLFEKIAASDAIAVEAAKTALHERYGRSLDLVQSLGEILVYNRVEGLRLQGRAGLSQWPFRSMSLSAGGGYGLGDRQWKADAAFLVWFNRARTLFLDGTVYGRTGHEEDRADISTAMNSFTSLLYKGDYRDYYGQRGGRIGLGIRPSAQTALKIDLIHQRETDAGVNTRFSLFRHGKAFRINPDILEGLFRGVRLSAVYSSYLYEAEIRYEQADRRLESDFTCRSVSGNLQAKKPVSRHSDLYLHLQGGWSWGGLPPQRWFDFGGRLPLVYHGRLRGVEHRAFTGDRMAMGVLEFSLKGAAVAGIPGLGFAGALKLTFWAGAGWSRLSAASRRLAAGLEVPLETTDGIYHELGLGLGDMLNVFRLDLGWQSRDERFFVRLNMLQ